jgi:alpha-glucosidase (family GH31 glycosyl hydrolase)
MKLLLWQIPLLKEMRKAPAQLRLDRDQMLERDYAVKLVGGRPYRNRGWWFPGALMPDFTSEEARQWWTDKRRYLVEDLGVDGFKTDGGEHAWGEDLRYADGSRGGAGNNLYPVLYSAAYHRLFSQVGREGVTFSRAGFTGSQSFPCHWAGDEDSTWDAYRAAIIAGVTAGACGLYFWGWDLAGFSGEIPSAELYLRAAGMACFCPIMQYHSEFNGHRTPSRDRTPWNIAERTGDPRVLPVFRRLAEVRHRLKPYLVAQAKRSIETNRPLMRALVFDHPDDQLVWEWPLQYMLGDDILVAPVVTPGAESWPTYLPSGQWLHLWTGEELTGPKVVEFPAPIDQVPVFIRRGAASKLSRALLPIDYRSAVT